MPDTAQAGAHHHASGQPHGRGFRRTPQRQAQARPLEQQGDAGRREAERGKARPDGRPHGGEDAPAESGTERAGGTTQIRP